MRGPLVKIWNIMDCICGKRLKPVLAEVIRKLEQFREITLDEKVRQKLLRISASPIDRLLEGERRVGIDSDSGGEFINHHLYRYCQEERLTFTRTRSYRKNDNCFVEQKNYSVVRRAVGYLRYDTEEELRALNELYRYLRLYTNFFQPTMKLIEKTRAGSKVTKKYDHPKTPYERVIKSLLVSDTDKKRLRQQYKSLNPASLKRQITRLQQKLLRMADMQKTRRKHNAA